MFDSLYLVALLGGAASVLTPCVLPLLPSILAFSTREGKRRAWGIVAGIEVSFIGISLLLGATLTRLGLPANTLTVVAAVLMGAFGLILLVPQLEEAFQRATSRAVSRLPQARTNAQGFWGGALAGMSLGLVWAPCAGPILAAITAGAASHGFTARTLGITLAYGAGMVLPLFAIVSGGHRVGVKLRSALGGGRRVLAPMGAVLLVTAVLIGFGGLTKLDNEIAKRLDITSTPTAGIERKALNDSRGGSGSVSQDSGRPSTSDLEAQGYPATDPGTLGRLGPAPDFSGIHHWYNTPGDKPLTIKQLRGKVVLVDFWTYSCINCIRTLPHIRDLYSKYHDKGLVVVGVHTPEFQFEKDEGNVKRAIGDLDVTWPVATDPDSTTWGKYYNQYWPAHYLIDRTGTIRAVHYGEGEYASTEMLVRKLLGEQAMPMHEDRPDTSGQPTTPETYLGSNRANPNQWASHVAGHGDEPLAQDTDAVYASPASLAEDEFGYTGHWTIGGESVTAGAGAKLRLHYRAQNVYMVLAPPADGSAGSITWTDSEGHGTHTMTVDADKLYTLRDGKQWADGTMTITPSPGVTMFTFTFG